MRVLLVNDSARAHNGGMNRVVVETCAGLQQAGHSIGLVYQDRGPVDVTCPVFNLPEGGAPGELTRLVQEFRPDVIQIHYVRREGLLEEADLAGPTCVFLHDQTWFCPSGDRMNRRFEPCHRPHGPACLFWNYAQGCGGKHPLGNFLRWRRTERLSVLKRLPRVRLQVASRFMRQGLVENGYATDRVDLVPLFAEPPACEEVIEPGLLLLPSRLAPGKGVDLALSAATLLEDLPGWRLVIAGDGNQRAQLELQAQHSSIRDRVTFLGEVQPAALDVWYGRAQIILFPVLRREPFGLIGVEALAHGRPIVAFPGGAVDEWLVDGGTGISVSERSPAAFAAALRELLSDPARCARLGVAAGNHYERFRPEAYIARLLASFERTRDGHNVH